MFTITSYDETWGTKQPVGRPHFTDTYADAKGLITNAADIIVKDIVKATTEYRVRTLPSEPGAYYGVVIEWCPDGQLAPLDASEEGFIRDQMGLQRAVVIEAFADA
jgi:hypothetical protein